MLDARQEEEVIPFLLTVVARDPNLFVVALIALL